MDDPIPMNLDIHFQRLSRDWGKWCEQYIAMEKRMRDLEGLLLNIPANYSEHMKSCICAFCEAREAALSGARTAGEPLPKLECGMGCGRTFCSAEGRDHHEELCSGTAKHG